MMPAHSRRNQVVNGQENICVLGTGMTKTLTLLVNVSISAYLSAAMETLEEDLHEYVEVRQ